MSDEPTPAWAAVSRPRMTPAERSARSRVAAAARWKNLGPDERRQATAAARRAWAAKFDEAPNPKAARAEHMARMQMAALRRRRTGRGAS